MQNKRADESQLFIDCAFYGYIGGVTALLKAGRAFPHSIWVEALQSAALGQNRDIVNFMLGQFVLQKADIIVDPDWFKGIEERSPEIARDIDVCDRYVRSIRMQVKLREKGVMAPDVEQPSFLNAGDDVTYHFGGEGESGIVGDHSQRRRANMEATASERAASKQAATGWGELEVIVESSWSDPS